jgi:hypothetical protein
LTAVNALRGKWDTVGIMPDQDKQGRRRIGTAKRTLTGQE